MDWENPLRTIAATVDADVLKALAAAEESVTGNELARLSGRSYAQVYAVVRRMVGEGLVRSVRYGRTNTYRLNRDHVVAQGIVRLLAAPGRIEGEIRRFVGAWKTPAETVAFVGEAAHRRVIRDGELEILIVRPSGVGRHDSAWRGQVAGLVETVERVSGNPVHLHDVDQAELRERVETDSAFFTALHAGARVLFGTRPTLRRTAES